MDPAPSLDCAFPSKIAVSGSSGKSRLSFSSAPTRNHRHSHQSAATINCRTRLTHLHLSCAAGFPVRLPCAYIAGAGGSAQSNRYQDQSSTFPVGTKTAICYLPVFIALYPTSPCPAHTPKLEQCAMYDPLRDAVFESFY